MSAVLDQPGAVRDENAFDPAVILPFLRQHIPDLPDETPRLQQFQGGASNITYQLNFADRALILRRPPAGTKPKSGHDMGREYRVMRALHGHFPVPQPFAFCEDERLIGSPFYVMEKLEGIILRRDLPKGMSYSPDEARELNLALIDTLVRLHTLDYDAIGLGDLGKPAGYVERQLEGWCERFAKVWTDDVPKWEAPIAWLRAHRPADFARPALIHNDYRFDNVVLAPADRRTIIGVLDWEMCTLGDPLMDLGSALAYWVEAGDPQQAQAIRMQPSALPGMLTRRAFINEYSQRSGIEVTNPEWYYVFGLFRLAVIAQQIYYRFKLGQTKNPRVQMFGMFVTVLHDVASKALDRGSL